MSKEYPKNLNYFEFDLPGDNLIIQQEEHWCN